MLRKNTAGQFVHFQGVDSATGGIKSGVSWTMRICKDGTFGAKDAGTTITEDGTTGWYKVALAQADTNANNLGYNFTGTGAIPMTINVVTTACDPTSTAFGLSLAKTTNITGFNDIAATAVVSSGAITTSGGAVSTVTTLTNLPAITSNWLTATGLDTTAAAEIADAVWDEDIVAAHGTADTAGRAVRTLDAISDRANNANLNAVLGVPDSAGADVYTDIIADTDDIQTRLPAALVGGRMDSNVQAMANDVITAAALATDAVTEIQSGLATAAALDAVDNFVDTEITDIQNRLPATLSSGRMRVDVEAINATTDPAVRLSKSAAVIYRGTVTTTSTTTSVVCSSLDPGSATNDQFKGRIMIFDQSTSSANLKGQATDITAFNNGTLTFTVTALTHAPASGDTFVIV